MIPINDDARTAHQDVPVEVQVSDSLLPQPSPQPGTQARRRDHRDRPQMICCLPDLLGCSLNERATWIRRYLDRKSNRRAVVALQLSDEVGYLRR